MPLIGLLFPLLCFWQAVPKSWREAPATASTTPTAQRPERQLLTRAIRDIRPGMRVLAENPELAGHAIGESDITPEEWCVVKLEMPKPDGGRIDMELMRPKAWLALHALAQLVEHPDALPPLKDADSQPPNFSEWLVGRTIDLDLPEMGASGPAVVRGIGPCPSIESAIDANRRIVTGRFHHSAATLIDLLTESESKPLGVTDNHPFWSADRQEFVPAGELRIGERLLRADATTVRVARITPRRGPPTPVYNLEVDAQHVYYVGANGVLVHNSYNVDKIVNSLDELPIMTPGMVKGALGDAYDKSTKWAYSIHDHHWYPAWLGGKAVDGVTVKVRGYEHITDLEPAIFEHMKSVFAQHGLTQRTAAGVQTMLHNSDAVSQNTITEALVDFYVKRYPNVTEQAIREALEQSL